MIKFSMILLSSVLGAILLLAGLYSFLWGKNKEAKNRQNEEKPNQDKEELALEQHYIACTASSRNSEVVGAEEKGNQSNRTACFVTIITISEP